MSTIVLSFWSNILPNSHNSVKISLFCSYTRWYYYTDAWLCPELSDLGIKLFINYGRFGQLHLYGGHYLKWYMRWWAIVIIHTCSGHNIGPGHWSSKAYNLPTRLCIPLLLRIDLHVQLIDKGASNRTTA